MNADALIAWWKSVPSSSQKYERLKPKGAIASQLVYSKGDIGAVVAHFRKESARLSSRYPKFWRELAGWLQMLEAELERAALTEIVNELGE